MFEIGVYFCIAELGTAVVVAAMPQTNKRRKRPSQQAAPVVDEDAELVEIERRCADEAPAPGSQPDAPFPLFEEMPLSSRTKEGLKAGGSTAPTATRRARRPWRQVT